MATLALAAPGPHSWPSKAHKEVWNCTKGQWTPLWTSNWPVYLNLYVPGLSGHTDLSHHPRDPSPAPRRSSIICKMLRLFSTCQLDVVSPWSFKPRNVKAPQENQTCSFINIDYHMHNFYIKHSISIYNVKYMFPILNFKYFICFESVTGADLKKNLLKPSKTSICHGH